MHLVPPGPQLPHNITNKWKFQNKVGNFATWFYHGLVRPILESWFFGFLITWRKLLLKFSIFFYVYYYFILRYCEYSFLCQNDCVFFFKIKLIRFWGFLLPFCEKFQLSNLIRLKAYRDFIYSFNFFFLWKSHKFISNVDFILNAISCRWFWAATSILII